jgi:prohibitin 1
MTDTTTAAHAPPAGDATAQRPPRRPGRLRLWLRDHRPEIIIVLLVAAIIFVFLLPRMLYSIPAGHVGVHWKRFGGGTATDYVFPEGIRFVLPWDRLYIYDARLQQVSREVKVLSSDGLQIAVDLAWRFHIVPGAAGKLHKYVGPDYQETLIAPTISARARDVMSIYDPSEIYTESRLTIQNEIGETVGFDLKKRFNPEGAGDLQWFVFEDILIKDITLPQGVQEAIVRKNAAFHEMEMYTFVIQREQKESERKRIEAVGIRNFQEIVSNGMNDAYLRWRGIEATLDLAKSPNAKVVVIGGGKNSLPLILNADGGNGVREGTDAKTAESAATARSLSAAAAKAHSTRLPVQAPSPDDSPPEAASLPESAVPKHRAARAMAGHAVRSPSAVPEGAMPSPANTATAPGMPPGTSSGGSPRTQSSTPSSTPPGAPPGMPSGARPGMAGGMPPGGPAAPPQAPSGTTPAPTWWGALGAAFNGKDDNAP